MKKLDAVTDYRHLIIYRDYAPYLFVCGAFDEWKWGVNVDRARVFPNLHEASEMRDEIGGLAKLALITPQTLHEFRLFRNNACIQQLTNTSLHAFLLGENGL